MANKIFIVKEEFSNDGEISFNTYPCHTRELAENMVDALKEIWDKTSTRFKGEIFNPNGEMEIDDSNNEYNIYDPCDAYYLNISIIEQEIYSNVGDVDQFKKKVFYSEKAYQQEFAAQSIKMDKIKTDNIVLVKKILDNINWRIFARTANNVLNEVNKVNGGFEEKMAKAKQMYQGDNYTFGELDYNNELVDCAFTDYDYTIVFTLVYNEENKRVHLSSGLEIEWKNNETSITFLYQWNCGYISDFIDENNPISTIDCTYYLPIQATDAYNDNKTIFFS